MSTGRSCKPVVLCTRYIVLHLAATVGSELEAPELKELQKELAELAEKTGRQNANATTTDLGTLPATTQRVAKEKGNEKKENSDQPSYACNK